MEIRVTSRKSPRTGYPLAQVFRDLPEMQVVPKSVALQVFKDLPTIQLVPKSVALQVFMDIPPMSPVVQSALQMKPILNAAVLAQLKPVLTSFHDLAESGAFSVLGQQRRETLARISADYGSIRVPTARELREIEASLLSHLPRMPEEVVQVEQCAAPILADPEHISMIHRATSGITRRDIAELLSYALLILAAWLLFDLAVLPNGLSAIQVIGVIVTMVAITQNQRLGE